MSNMYSRQEGTMDWVDGSSAAFSFRIDRERLATAVRRAAKSKGGKCTAGPIKVEARWLKRPAESTATLEDCIAGRGPF